jgi:SAM-dependent methyltransferase
MPFANERFDAVTCFNVLEHVYDYRGALVEICRVLRPGGVLYGYVPFICDVHPTPFDFWRFTDTCIERCLTEAGMTLERIVNHSGILVSCFDLSSFLVKKVPPLRTGFAAAALVGDLLLARLRPDICSRFPVGYFFVGRKDPR